MGAQTDATLRSQLTSHHCGPAGGLRDGLFARRERDQHQAAVQGADDAGAAAADLVVLVVLVLLALLVPLVLVLTTSLRSCSALAT